MSFLTRSVAGRSAWLALLATGTISLTTSSAMAGGPTKEECIDAHAKGQDARDGGHLTLAHNLFTTCAQSTCPSLIQGDCARFTDELSHLQPTVAFSARDGSGADMPDTTVFVDGVLVATHLGDGSTRDIDPGTHTVRFQNGDRQVNVTVVISPGEKARVITASFGAPPGKENKPAVNATTDKTVEVPAGPSRPVFPLVISGIGAAALVGGAIAGLVGLGQVPSNCSLGAHTCVAPPNDPVFDQAKSAVTLADIGLITAGVGAGVAVVGLVWYFVQHPKKEAGPVAHIVPWLGSGAGGVSAVGSF